MWGGGGGGGAGAGQDRGCATCIISVFSYRKALCQFVGKKKKEEKDREAGEPLMVAAFVTFFYDSIVIISFSILLYLLSLMFSIFFSITMSS